jgi:ribosomal protein S18 acetylase RimI-like enzyme
VASIGGQDPLELRRRAITEADNESWVKRFSCGDDAWCAEVDDFLKEWAWAWQQVGQCNTSLFSVPDSDAIAGFFVVAASVLARQLREDAEAVLGAEFPLKEVPCCKIPYFGVSKESQGAGIGKEMWSHLLQDLEETVLSPRLVVLEVREANGGALAFWTGMGFSEYGQKFRLKGEPDSEPALVRLMFDRFSGS